MRSARSSAAEWRRVESVYRLPLGQPSGQDGIWFVAEGARDKLLFEVQGGEVAAILGGFVQICE